MSLFEQRDVSLRIAVPPRYLGNVRVHVLRLLDGALLRRFQNS